MADKIARTGPIAMVRGVAFPGSAGSLPRVEGEVPELPTCKNCGAPLTGEYCANCGQRDYDFNRSFGEIGAELAESFFNWDMKLIRAVYDLIFRPGLLTKDYLAGKRASQVPPLRFYLFVSILYFLVASFSPGSPLQINSPQANVPVADLQLDPQTKATVQKAQEAYEAAKKKNPDSTEVWINDLLRERMKHLDEIQKAIKEHYPTLIFALLPVFALITRIVFRRARLGFLSHLVMALHLHSFFFLFSVAAGGWAKLAGALSSSLGGVIDLAAGIYLVIYAFLATRRVFGQSTWGTLWRAALAGMLYSISLGIGSVILVIIMILLA